MDVMRIDSDDNERRFCVCVASYGYMGDLMRQSEKMRFLGPSRYNLAGAATLFKNRVRAHQPSPMFMSMEHTAEAHFSLREFRGNRNSHKWTYGSDKPPCAAMVLSHVQSYRAKITYLPDASRASSFTAKHVCKAHCELCQAAGANRLAHTDVFQPGNTFDGLPGVLAQV